MQFSMAQNQNKAQKKNQLCKSFQLIKRNIADGRELECHVRWVQMANAKPCYLHLLNFNFWIEHGLCWLLVVLSSRMATPSKEHFINLNLIFVKLIIWSGVCEGKLNVNAISERKYPFYNFFFLSPNQQTGVYQAIPLISLRINIVVALVPVPLIWCSSLRRLWKHAYFMKSA